MSVRSESESQQQRAPHRNTAESIERGNALLAEAHAARLRGTQLRKQSDALCELSDEAYREARRKDDEAHEVLFGRHTNPRNY